MHSRTNFRFKSQFSFTIEKGAYGKLPDNRMFLYEATVISMTDFRGRNNKPKFGLFRNFEPILTLLFFEFEMNDLKIRWLW